MAVCCRLILAHGTLVRRRMIRNRTLSPTQRASLGCLAIDQTGQLDRRVLYTSVVLNQGR